MEVKRWDTAIKGSIRTKPTPPSFNSKAARITEPNVGASTWAIGSHWCKPYIGSLTANAIKINRVISNVEE